MPPMRPAKMIVNPVDASIDGSSAPVLPSCTFSTEVVTVTATSTDRNAPTRLRTPARRTAVFGFRAPVAIDVAMAFPVSWKPLVKSKASAVTINSTRMINSALMRSFCGLANSFDEFLPNRVWAPTCCFS
jgi:hypothetical protein